MNLALKFLFSCFLCLATIVQANTPNDTSVDTEAVLANYIASWSMTDATQRLSALKTIWTEDGVHESPYGRSEGITAINQEIEGFLKMFPGARVTLEDIKQTGNQIVCTFILKNTDGAVVMKGTDYFEFTEAGKLLKVVGFVAQQ